MLNQLVAHCLIYFVWLPQCWFAFGSSRVVAYIETESIAPVDRKKDEFCCKLAAL